MTSFALPETRFPVTVREWELVLTRALLRADDGNADPIRSFEITPERLAFFCGKAPEHAVEAEIAFRRALIADRNLTIRLQHGSFRRAGAEVPGCLTYLALSLLVDSLLDNEYTGSNEYRAKLRQWLGIDRSFMVLRGIALMWEELAAWLNERVAEGAPFRRLILPDSPKTWTHIGYTRYLSFPTRRDLRFLEKQIRRSPKLAGDPASLVRLLDPEIPSSSVSFGLKEAFSDFRTALRSGRASVDHRFWGLVEKARHIAGEPVVLPSELRMEFDEDGRRQYRLHSLGTTPSFPIDIGAAVSTRVLLGSPNLGPGARRGILVFHSVGLASWSATGEPPIHAGEYHLAVEARHERLANVAPIAWESSGGWFVTKSPVSAGTVSDVLKRLGVGNGRENLILVGLADGVRVGSSWLGAERLLPRLEGASGTVDVRQIRDVPNVGLRLVDGRLVSNGTVEGEYLFSDTEGAWSRRATFVAYAEVHGELSGAAYAAPLHQEWQSVALGRVRVSAEATVEWDNRPYEYQDLLEALYASARTGIGQGDAIALIDRVAGQRRWDFLRMLVETSFFDERLRLRWRGRTFTLGKPVLERTKVGSSHGVIVSGAVPARLEDDFKRTVSAQGGTAFRRMSYGFAPPLIGAVGLNETKLADALGWTISSGETLPTRRPDENLVQTAIIGESYVTGAYWDWTRGKFSVDGVVSGPVTLTRLVHPGGRDHDLYRVVGSRIRTFTSRHSAILDAHSQAGIPMFECKAGQVRRLTLEGAFPIEIARALRRLTLINGGPCREGWTYQVSIQEEAWLAALLPGLIAGIAGTSNVKSGTLSRRGRGARRAVWLDGGIVA